MGQLAEAKQRMAQAAAEEEQSKVKLGMAEKELGTLKGRMKDFEREAGDSKKKLEGMRGTVEGIKSKIAKCGWSAEKEGEGEAKLREAKSAVRNLGEVCMGWVFARCVADLMRLLAQGSSQA